MARNVQNNKTSQNKHATRSLLYGKTGLSVFTTCLLASTCLLVAANPAAAEKLEGDDALETIVVTASGSQTDIINAPASVTVVSAEEISKLPAQDIREILKRVPGITINHAGNLDKVQIRGLGERYTLFLIDGKRVNSAPNLFRGNDYNSGWVPIEAIERIEVVRGPMSSLYGSDAIGGVINIITKKESAEWHGSLTTEITLQENKKSGNYGRAGFHLSGPLVQDKLFLRTYGSFDYRQADADDINPGTTWRGDPLPGFFESDDRFIDTTLTWLINDTNELDVNYGYSRRLQDLNTLTRHSGGITHRGSYDFAQTELKIYGDQIHNDYGHGNTNQDMQPNTAYNFNVDGKINKAFELVIPHKLTIGAAYKYQKVEDKYVLTGPEGTESSVWQSALFVEDQLEITDRFNLTVGTRLDNHEHFGWHASPRIYGVFNLTDKLTLKGGWSSSFKAPTLLENSPSWYQISCGGGCYLVGTEDLDPEIGSSFEIGVNYEGKILSGSVTGFYNNIQDMIPFPPARTGDLTAALTYPNYVGLSSDGKPMFSFENIDQARTMGVEFDIAIRAMDNLTLTANYTYLDAKATSGVKRPLAYQPEHSANFGIDWQATEKLNLGLDVNYVGEQYTWVPSNGNMAWASKADAYVTADITGQYDVNEHFTLRAGILNVADKQVFREISDDFNIDGRRYFLSATARF